MTRDKTYKTYFKDNGHLNEIGISVCAEALINNDKENIDSEILNHVEDCLECKSDILELFEIIKENSESISKNSTPSS